MKILNNRLLLTISLLLIAFVSNSQEIVVPLTYNSNYYNKPVNTQSALKSGSISDTLELPFIDDFSLNVFNKHTPDERYWLDDLVYVNSNYVETSPTLGVATFDALNGKGELYETKSLGAIKADSLTSKLINLNRKKSDSVYLSFYFSSKSISDAPDKADSLVLKFKTKQNKWVHIWSSAGVAMDDFKKVMIPITDTSFLYKGFQFMFYNYVTIIAMVNPDGKNSNGDIWNLDYVKLDAKRSWDDTIDKDIAVVKPLKSFLNNFESMPWRHYIEHYDGENVDFNILSVRNTEKNTISVGHRYRIVEKYSGISPGQPKDYSVSIASGTTHDFIDNFKSFYITKDDSSIFTIKSFITVGNNDPFGVGSLNVYKNNDTVFYEQVFKNYYAYDDGSAELGYGIYGEGSFHANVALEYNSRILDTLSAVDIFFNRAVTSNNTPANAGKTFYLAVWDTLYSSYNPGKLLYKQLDTIKYEPGINKFHRYYIREPFMLPQERFFVGWIQQESMFMNVGFDCNRIHNEKVYYSKDSLNWSKSGLKGSLMIRPVFGKVEMPTYIKKHPSSQSQGITVYPNPCKDVLNLKLSGISSQTKFQIFDFTGRVVMNGQLVKSSLSIQQLKEGMYILKVNDSKGKVYTAKFVKVQR